MTPLPSECRILSILTALVLLLLPALAGSAMAQNENEQVGFSSTHIFDGGYFGENVDTLNGNLTLTVPIGPTYQVNKNLSYQLKLNYNSKIWEFTDATGTAAGTRLMGQSPMGAGFALTFGRLYFDSTFLNSPGSWYFVTPDGARHDMGGASDPVMSWDTTYFKPTKVTIQETGVPGYIITNQSGIRYTLGHKVTVPGATTNWSEHNAAFGGWYVTLIEDMTSGSVGQDASHPLRYPNWIEVQYEDGKGYGQCIQRVLDSLGREILFHNSWDGGNENSARTETITLPKISTDTSTPAVNNSYRATYAFAYTYQMQNVPPAVPNVPSGARQKYNALILNSITLPPISPANGFRIFFDYQEGAELYLRTLPMNKNGDPAGSRMEYVPETYSYESKSMNGSGTVSVAGVTRHIRHKYLYLGSSANPSATWDYNRTTATNITNPTVVTVRTCLPGPTDCSTALNETVHYFHGSPRSPGAPSPDGTGSHDGYAPEWDDGLNYRTEYWEGEANRGKLIRSEETEYIPDMDLGSYTKSNIRPMQRKTIHNDDGGKEVVTSYSDWDSAGHWMNESETGFGMTTSRVSRKRYNSTAIAGTTNDSKLIIDYEEINDGGTVISRTDYSYDAYGRVNKSIQRRVAGGPVNLPVNTTEEDGDVVTAYQYDPRSGNVKQKTISPGPNGVPYTILYTYNKADGINEWGPYLATKKFGSFSWNSINWERDGNTGLIRKSCDPASLCTCYSYDDLGRITGITPIASGTSCGGSIPNGADFPTAIIYTGLDDTPGLAKTKVRQSKDPSQECSASVNNGDCIYAEYTYDDLARLVKTKKRDSEGFSVAQQVTYDAISNVLSRSEWVKLDANGDPTNIDETGGFSTTLNLVNGYPSTTYSYRDPITGGFDPLGRPWMATTADMKETDTFYRGQDTTVTVKGINGRGDNPLDVTTTYTKDALGRLTHVSYPVGQFSAGNATMSAAQATYSYDLKDNIIGVDLLSIDLTTHQNRSFAYDGLDRLIREDNPENGTTLYEAYDGLGNLLKKQDSAGQVLTLAYDPAGRLVDTKNNTIVIAHNSYDETGPEPFGFSAGKLTTVQSFADNGALQITQKYYFQDPEGRLSGENTALTASTGWDTGTTPLTTSYQYNRYGLRTKSVYPSEGGSRSPQDLTATYTNGFQRTLRDTPNNGITHVSEIQYNPAGGIWKIFMPGSADLIQPDARNRPQSITITGSFPSSGGGGGGGGDGGGGGGNGGGGGSGTGGGTRQREPIGRLGLPGMEPYRAIGQGGSALYSSGPYVYDGAGNISQIGPSLYRYDEANRLVSASEVDTDYSVAYTLSWAYDPFGNMTASTNTPSSGGEIDRNFCANGSTTCTFSNNQIPIYSYDLRGNLVTDAGHAYNYDVRNRLVRIDTLSGSSLPPIPQGTFIYNAAGQRMVKTVDGVTAYYIRDQQGQVLSEFRKSATSSSPPAWDRDYLYAAGRLVAEYENDNPHTPSGLMINVDEYADSVHLEWQAPPDTDLASYQIHEVAEYPHQVTHTYTVPATQSYYDATPDWGIKYDYYVVAVDTADHLSTPTETLSVRTDDNYLPTQPIMRAPSLVDRQVTLTWDPSTDNVQVLGYEIFRNSVLASPPTLVRGRSFVDFNLNYGTNYAYQVRSVDTAGNRSALSNMVTVIPVDHVPPTPPKNVTASAGCGISLSTIAISWDTNPPEDGASEYRIYRHDPASSFDFTGVPLATVPLGGTTYSDSSVAAGTQYTYVVIAADSAGNTSQPSNEVEAMLRSTDTDVAPPLAPVAYPGDGNVTLVWQGAQCSTSPNCKNFAIYRRPNTSRDCADYVRVGTLPLSPNTGGRYTYRDFTVINAVAYEYALGVIDTTGKEGLLSDSTLAVPLETIKDVRACRVLDSPPNDPCVGSDFPCCDGRHPCVDNSCIKGTWSWRWNPVQTKVYHPATASVLDALAGYFKGYRVYNHPKTVAYELKWVDYRTLPTNRLEDGLHHGTDCEVPPGDFEDPDTCRVVTGVYKVFVNGNWESLESGYSDNFQPNASDYFERCPYYLKTGAWCDLPICTQDNTPPPPTDVQAAGTAPGEITVTWQKPLVNGQAYQDISGFLLYVDDTSYTENDPHELFRQNHPVLRLGPEATSVVLAGLSSCRDYVFYLVSVSSSGRISDASEKTTLAIHAPSYPGDVKPPTNVRLRLWTANDRVYAPGDGSSDSTRLLRIMWNSCRPGSTTGGRIYACTSATNLNDETCPGAAVGIFYSSDYSNELTVTPPANELQKYYVVVECISGTNCLASETAPGFILPHDDPPLSPPSHFQARAGCTTTNNNTVCSNFLRWCPTIPEEQMLNTAGVEYKYKILLSNLPGGPYVQIDEVNVDANTTNKYVDSQHVDPDSHQVVTTDPFNHRYYYVIQAARSMDGGVTWKLSSYSPENGAGNSTPNSVHFNFDPDSYNWDSEPWDSTVWDKPQNCNDDDVENRPSRQDPLLLAAPSDTLPLACFGAPAIGGRDVMGETSTGRSDATLGRDPTRESEWARRTDVLQPTPRASPYRMIGTGGPTYHITYYHLDHLGSPRILTDSNGVLVQRQHFLPFGEEMPIESGVNARKFTGHERDSETGLDYMLARYYQAGLGRFLSVDQGGDSDILDPQSWNPYLYTRNNPLKFVDPDGQRILYGNSADQAAYAPTLSQVRGESSALDKAFKQYEGKGAPDLLIQSGGVPGPQAGTTGAVFSITPKEAQSPEEIKSATVISATITIDPSKNQSPEQLQKTIIEEGAHANDAYNNPLTNAKELKDPKVQNTPVENRPAEGRVKPFIEKVNAERQKKKGKGAGGPAGITQIYGHAGADGKSVTCHDGVNCE